MDIADAANETNMNGEIEIRPVETLEHMEVSDESTLLQQLMAKIKPSACGEKRTYSTIDISADKWLLTLDEKAQEKLKNPPSLADGLDIETEKDLRFLGCELIQSGSILLKLPQTAAATAQILFQRYYYEKSFVRFNFEHTVMACLLLASKIEEEPRRPREVINVYNRLKQLYLRRTSGNPRRKVEHLALDKNYVVLKNLVIKTERRLLNTLGFVVHVNHPHKLIYAYLHSLKCLSADNTEILQKAWSYMNDGLRTDIFVRYKPETIACACIYLAARTVDPPIALPKTPFPWYELYDASDRDVKAISLILLNLYTRTKPASLTKLSALVEQLYNEKYAPKPVEPPPKPIETKPMIEKVTNKVAEVRPNKSKDRKDEGKYNADRGDRDHRRNGRQSPSRRMSRSRDRRDKHRRRSRDRENVKPKYEDREIIEVGRKESRKNREEIRWTADDDRERDRGDRKKERERDRELTKQRDKLIRQTLGKRPRSSVSPSPTSKFRR